MPKLIIGLVGKQGCGKGTVADILRKNYGAGYSRYSAILGDILKRLAVEPTRDNFIKTSEMIRKAFGEDVMSYAICAEALQAKEDIVIIDGIRRPEDIVALEPLSQFHLIAVDADPKLRFERMKKRGEKASETEMTWDQFLATEQASTEITIPSVMVRAQVTIMNDGSLEDLNKHVDELMKKWKS